MSIHMSIHMSMHMCVCSNALGFALALRIDAAVMLLWNEAGAVELLGHMVGDAPFSEQAAARICIARKPAAAAHL